MKNREEKFGCSPEQLHEETNRQRARDRRDETGRATRIKTLATADARPRRRTGPGAGGDIQTLAPPQRLLFHSRASGIAGSGSAISTPLSTAAVQAYPPPCSHHVVHRAQEDPEGEGEGAQRVRGVRGAGALRPGVHQLRAQERLARPLHQLRQGGGRVRKPQGYHHPRALPPAQGLPEDPRPPRARAREEVQRQGHCAHCHSAHFETPQERLSHQQAKEQDLDLSP